VLSSSPLVHAERRQESRYRVVLPVVLEDAVAWTRDVSASGAYVTLRGNSHPLAQEGAHLKLEFVLEHVNPNGPVKLACDGEVLRVDQEAEHVGLAVRITAYRFSHVISPLEHTR